MIPTCRPVRRLGFLLARRVPILPEQRLKDVRVLDILVSGKKIDGELAVAITSAHLEFNITAATTLTMEVVDSHRKLIRSGRFVRGLLIQIPRSDGTGYDSFALAAVSKSGDVLTLTFEDEVIYRLRQVYGLKKANRGSVTRAGFVYGLVRELKPRPKFFSPELYDKQAVVPSDRAAQDELKNDPVGKQSYGFSGDTVKVKHVAATTEQRGNIKRVLDVGVKIRAPKTVLVSAIATITQEASAINLKGGDRDSQGLFQQRPSSGWTGLQDVEKAAKQFYLGQKEDGKGGAIEYFKNNPGATVAEISQHVQNSAFPDAYKKWEAEARDTVNSYLGTDARNYRGSTSRVSKKNIETYEFTRGNPDDPTQAENSWDAIRRLADEVAWYAYVYRNTVYFVSGDELSNKDPYTFVEEFQDGVFTIDFDYETNTAQSAVVDQVSVTAAISRWTVPPGGVVGLAGCGPADGQWITTNMQRSLFDERMTITLNKPQQKQLEPAPVQQTVETDPVTGKRINASNDVRQGIVDLAIDAIGKQNIHYDQGRRACADWRTGQTVYMDCSSFASECYILAGADPPDGSGCGTTSSMESKGKSVGKGSLQPADLVFYPNHVVVYIGGGKAVSHGGPTGPNPPHEVDINYRTPTSYRSYLD